MSQSARLRNLALAVRLSTASMRVSPRALSALTRFEPMNPAAPVTTVYIDSSSELDVDFADFRGQERHPRRNGAEKLIANSARRGGDVIDGQAFTPKHNRAADRGFGYLGQIDGEHVH